MDLFLSQSRNSVCIEKIVPFYSAGYLSSAYEYMTQSTIAVQIVFSGSILCINMT
jgi:hypothetical protein